MKYGIRKVITMIITILLVSFFVFLAFSVIPGDPATQMLGTNATPQKVALLREQMGLDRPLVIRYFYWLSDLAAGNMGISYTYHTPVASLLADKLPITIMLTVMSFLLILVLSVPLGITTAKYYDRYFAKIFDVLNQLCMAIPPFFIGIVLTFLFGLILHLFTPGGYVSYKENFGAFLAYLILPSLSIAIPKAAMNMRLLKTSVLDEARLDYVRTAYSRGNTTDQVLYRHVLRNALLPVVTFLGMTLTDIVAGSIVIEQVFSIPGFGRLLISSIANRDYPVAEAIIVIIAFLVVVINFLVDILYPVIDPRVGQHEK
ncbi:MAG: ABC transporter permease [Lachnospiraceae bacterium]|nr:ABC transporter permease [Lachnospiraceae bacterium]